MKVIDYDIVSDTRLAQLAQKTREKISIGWQPYGELQKHGEWWNQVVVIYEEEEEPVTPTMPIGRRIRVV